MKNITNLILFTTLFLLVSCGKSPRDARQELANLNIDYTKQSFAEHAYRGDSTAVKLFIIAKMDKKLALEAAVANNKKGIAKMLIEAGAKPTARNLREPADRGEYEFVKYLISKGAKPNSQTLIRPVNKGDYEFVKYLIDKGAKPDSQTLNVPVDRGEYEFAKYLISKGAKPNSQTLIEPVNKGDHEFVKYLIDKGAEPDSQTLNVPVDRGEYEFVKYLISNGAIPNARLLSGPVRKSNYKMVELLIDSGVNASDHSYLVMTATKRGADKIVEALLKGGCNPDYVGRYDDRKKTALQVAILKNYTEVVRALLEGGADLESWYRSRPLWYAVFVVNNVDIVKLLLDFGADPDELVSDVRADMSGKSLSDNKAGRFVLKALNN